VKSARKIGIIDYGTGNLRSVVKAFEFLGAQAQIITEPSQIDKIEALVFPGQGTFDQCIRALQRSALDKAIIRWIERGKPYFGICLGLQVLFERSEEGEQDGLAIFSGRVKRFSLPEGFKIPHMGWNSVDWELPPEDPMLRGLANGDQFYFVHSYHITDEDERLAVMKTDYGYPFTSGISFDNCFATQFHPEKSQAKGLQIYRNFLEKIP
jgi:imidazole glycerol-phosphate synthase subunit HisH